MTTMNRSNISRTALLLIIFRDPYAMAMIRAIADRGAKLVELQSLSNLQISSLIAVLDFMTESNKMTWEEAAALFKKTALKGKLPGFLRDIAANMEIARAYKKKEDK